MDKLFNSASSYAAMQACRLIGNNKGEIAPGRVFSFTGLALAIAACLLFIDAGFNVQSSTFKHDFLRAIKFFS